MALLSSLLILFSMKFTHLSKFKSMSFYPMNQIMCSTLIMNLLMLTWIGMKPVEMPYLNTGVILTKMYFSFYLMNPLIMKARDKMID